MRPSASVLSVESTMEICALCNARWSRLQNQRLRAPRARTELLVRPTFSSVEHYATMYSASLPGSRIRRERREKERRERDGRQWSLIVSMKTHETMRLCIHTSSRILWLSIFYHRQICSGFSFVGCKIILIYISSSFRMSRLSEIVISLE